MNNNKEDSENSRQRNGNNRSFRYSDFSLPANSQIQVKMPEVYRDYWVAAARQEKKSLSFVVTELLKARYGEPNSMLPETVESPMVAEPAAETYDIEELFGTGSAEIL